MDTKVNDPLDNAGLQVYCVFFLDVYTSLLYTFLMYVVLFWHVL